MANCSKWPNSKTAFWTLLKIEFVLHFMVLNNCAQFRKKKDSSASYHKKSSFDGQMDRRTLNVFGSYHIIPRWMIKINKKEKKRKKKKTKAK